MVRKRAFLAGCLVLIATLVALALACSGGGSTTDVKVSLNEWSVAPDVAVAKAGKIRFVARNDGKEPHEFVIVQTDLAPAALPVVEGKVDEEKVKVIDEIEPFASGETETKTVNLKAGKYVLICNIVERVPGQQVKSHYENGMRIALTVSR